MNNYPLEPVARDFNDDERTALEAYNPLFKKVFAFIDAHDLNALPDGRIEIDGDCVFCNVGSYPPRGPEQAKLEAHKVYIDMQCLIGGQIEQHGVMPAKDCRMVSEPYSDKKDIVFFADPWTRLETVKKGQFIVFTPEAAHAPCICPVAIRKAVFKVRA